MSFRGTAGMDMLNYTPKGSTKPLYSLSDLCYAIFSCPVVPFLSGGGHAP